jgi:GNAT superfamily N-acetyltransferase
MKLIEVNSDRTIRRFHQVPFHIYREDPHWIPHLEHDIEAIFTPGKNPDCHSDNHQRWVVERNGEAIGRVAAFFKKGASEGGIGFFESIPEYPVAQLLLDTATAWLKEKGFEKAQAPVNFGERDKYWGLLVTKGKEPSYQENYNPFYYKDYLETYGFVKVIEQTTSETDPVKFNYEKFSSMARRVTENPEFEIRHFEKSKMDQYAADFVSIYNEAWEQHEHFQPLTVKKIKKMFKSMKPILREDLIWFTYANQKPVAFYVSIIDVNQWFKKVNGKLNWWGKLKFLWAKWTVPITRIRGIVFGVVPDYQGRGLYSGMIMKIFEVFQTDPHLKSTELAWIGDFNPRMHALFESLGANPTKIHYTYEKTI